MSLRDKKKQQRQNQQHAAELANIAAQVEHQETQRPVRICGESETTPSLDAAMNNGKIPHISLESLFDNDTKHTEEQTMNAQAQVQAEVKTEEQVEETKSVINLNAVQEKYGDMFTKAQSIDWANVTGEELVTEFNIPSSLPMALFDKVVDLCPLTIQPFVKQAVISAAEEGLEAVNTAKLIDIVKPFVPMLVSGIQTQLVTWLMDRVSAWVTGLLGKVNFEDMLPKEAAPQPKPVAVVTMGEEPKLLSNLPCYGEIVFDLKKGVHVPVIMDKHFLSIKGSKRYSDLKEEMFQTKYRNKW